MDNVITIYAQADQTNQKFDVSVFEGSIEAPVNFTKGVKNNATFSVEQEESFDGSSYLIILMINNMLHLTKAVDGPMHMFTVKPEEGYLVDQFKIEEGNTFIIDDFKMHLLIAYLI